MKELPAFIQAVIEGGKKPFSAEEIAELERQLALLEPEVRVNVEALIEEMGGDDFIFNDSESKE